MPEDSGPGITDRVWAVLGLAAAVILAAISIDLLRPQRAPAPDAPAGGDEGDCGC